MKERKRRLHPCVVNLWDLNGGHTVTLHLSNSVANQKNPGCAQAPPDKPEPCRRSRPKYTERNKKKSPIWATEIWIGLIIWQTGAVVVSWITTGTCNSSGPSKMETNRMWGNCACFPIETERLSRCWNDTCKLTRVFQWDWCGRAAGSPGTWRPGSRSPGACPCIGSEDASIYSEPWAEDVSSLHNTDYKGIKGKFPCKIK